MDNKNVIKNSTGEILKNLKNKFSNSNKILFYMNLQALNLYGHLYGHLSKKK